MGSGKPFLVFGKPAIEETEIAEVVDSLRSGWIGTGPKVQRFERMLEDYVGHTGGSMRLVLHRGSSSRCRCSASDPATR